MKKQEKYLSQITNRIITNVKDVRMGKKKEVTLMENYNNLKCMINDIESDVVKNAEKGNFLAGQRFRKVIKQSKILLTTLRKQSLERKQS